jgi:LmbE family N-acetylglucosaminyl deacetylase
MNTTLDLNKAHTILGIQPHYDDNDIGAGGTLITLARRGTAVFYMTVTDDLVGVLDSTLTTQEAVLRLKQEQSEAGSIIGVSGQFWLGYPDAGRIDYFVLRDRIIRYIRLLRPDYLFTVDPWLPYEAHHDHVQTGRAVAEAALLFSFPRLVVGGKVNLDYRPHHLQGVVFYLSHTPNLFFDTSAVIEEKQRALSAYRSQFTSQDLEALQNQVKEKERRYGQQNGCAYAEALKILRPDQLHLNSEF